MTNINEQAGQGRTVAGNGDQSEPEAALAKLRTMLEDEKARRGLTVTQLARRAQLGRTTVHEALRPGNAAPTHRTVASLTRALNLPTDELLELRRIAIAEGGLPAGAESEPEAPAAPVSTKYADSADAGPVAAPARRVWHRRLLLGVPVTMVVASAAVTAVFLRPGWFSSGTASEGPSPDPTPSNLSYEPFRLNDPKARLNDGVFCVYDSDHGPDLGLACRGDLNFDWAVKPAGNSSFKLVNTATGRCLASSVKANKLVRSMACLDDNPVRWTVGTTTRWGQSLKNTDSGWCLAGLKMNSCNAEAVDRWESGDRPMPLFNGYGSQSEAGPQKR